MSVYNKKYHYLSKSSDTFCGDKFIKRLLLGGLLVDYYGLRITTLIFGIMTFIVITQENKQESDS